MLTIQPGAGITQSQLDSALTAARIQTQTATPTTGQTVVITDDSSDRLVVINPAGSLATLTITLPSEANSRVGQKIEIAFTQPIIALTIGGAVTIRNTLTAALLGDSRVFRKVAANTWHRVT